MHPIASAGFSEARTASRAALAEGMIFGILSHPESKNDALLRVVRGAWNEQDKPHVGGLAIRVGRRTGLARDLACFRKRKCERPPFPFVRFQLPDRVAQGIHSGDDPAPECRCRARTPDIERSLQEFNHRGGCRGMKEPLRRRAVFALDVAILRTTFAILVKKRLSIAADIVGESRRHSKSTVHESR